LSNGSYVGVLVRAAAAPTRRLEPSPLLASSKNREHAAMDRSLDQHRPMLLLVCAWPSTPRDDRKPKINRRCKNNGGSAAVTVSSPRSSVLGPGTRAETLRRGVGPRLRLRPSASPTPFLFPVGAARTDSDAGKPSANGRPLISVEQIAIDFFFF